MSSFNSHLKQLYISNKTEHFSYKDGYGTLGVHISKCLKEELAWSINSFLLVNKMLFKQQLLRNYRIKSFSFKGIVCQYCFYVKPFNNSLFYYKM